MRIILELFLFMSLLFPVFHMLNAIPKKTRGKADLIDNLYQRQITVLIPCFNEAEIIKNTVEGMMRVDYDNFKCFIINDGSTDATMDVLADILRLYRSEMAYLDKIVAGQVHGVYSSTVDNRFYIIDKQNRGKGDSLNVGINYASSDIIVTLDADCILKKDALKYVNQFFNVKKHMAASGVIHILQSYKLTRNSARLGLRLPGLLRIQTLEYIKSCYVYKVSLCKMNALTVISGAFGIFDRKMLIQMKGYRNTVGEDIDITLRMQFYAKQRNDREILFIPEAVCYTEGPENWQELIKQRMRWQKAFIECLIKYGRELFRKLFGSALSFFMVFDGFLVGTFSTMLYSSSYLLLVAGLFITKYNAIFLYYLLSVLIHLGYNTAGLLTAGKYGVQFDRRDIPLLILTVAYDIFVYRFMVIVFVIKGTAAYFINKSHWDKVKRSGTDYMVLRKQEDTV